MSKRIRVSFELHEDQYKLFQAFVAQRQRERAEAWEATGGTYINTVDDPTQIVVKELVLDAITKAPNHSR